jgi:hypothetical protein
LKHVSGVSGTPPGEFRNDFTFPALDSRKTFVVATP